jgi:calcium-dependent protein kinase
MGNMCSAAVGSETMVSPKKKSVISAKADLHIKAGVFVQENTGSFYSVYKLNSHPIGSGAFAEVWVCVHKRTEEQRAVKILNKASISQQDIKFRVVLQEVEILKSLDHPNIIKVFEYFEDPYNYYIVMEYCQGGDLFGHLLSSKKVTERYAAKVMKYLLSGLVYLHSKQVVHRDIKPENLLMINGTDYDDFSIKIIDFNVATCIKQNKVTGVAGTTDYIAPEVFRGVYDEKCDVWSSGVILYIMVSGILPFPCDNESVSQEAICTGKYSFPEQYFQNISTSCKDFITKLMTKNPKSRLSAKSALEHPWLLISEDTSDEKAIHKTVNRMSTYTKTSKLKEVFTTFMVSQLSKDSSVKKLEQVFYAMDINKDGVINLN